MTERPARQRVAKAPPTDAEVEATLSGIISRSMKKRYLDYAKKRGATDQWIAEVEQGHWKTVAQVVTIIYGDPD